MVLIDSLATHGGLKPRLQRWLSRVLLSLRRPRSGGHRYGPATLAELPLVGNPDPRRYTELMRAAGFDRIEVETLDQLQALELKAMPLVERWHAQERKYLFVARRD